jgi:hypothetical protein
MEGVVEGWGRRVFGTRNLSVYHVAPIAVHFDGIGSNCICIFAIWLDEVMEIQNGILAADDESISSRLECFICSDSIQCLSGRNPRFTEEGISDGFGRFFKWWRCPQNHHFG